MSNKLPHSLMSKQNSHSPLNPALQYVSVMGLEIVTYG